VGPVVVAALTVGTVYTAVRRLLPRIATLLVRRLPESVLQFVPDRLVPAGVLRDAGLARE
jgi:hypothetical protein